MNQTASTISIAILAGGKSLRFGEPKSKALLGNQELIRFSLNVARSISSYILLISDQDMGAEYADLQCLPDIIPGKGPLGGIYTALSFAVTPFVATMPCDMPFLVPDVFHILIDHIDDVRPVVAVSDKGMEPLIAIWHQAALPVIGNNLKRNLLSIRRTLAELRAVSVSMPKAMKHYQPEIFTNINYKEDLGKAQEAVNRKELNF